MPNEVEIRITANDLTSPAVAGAIARMRALKAATQGMGFNDMSRGLNDSLNKMGHLREEVNRLSFGKIDTSQLGSSLTALKSKIQALGIADIADVNVQPGKIMSQLQIVKRMVDQAGITDLLDVNVNTGDLAKQLDKIGNLTETIPVLFDMSKIPNFGTQSVIHVPIMFDVGKIPQFGDVSPILSAASAEGKLAKATEEANAAGYASGPIWSSSTRKIIDYAASLQSGTRYNGLFGDALVQLMPLLGDLWTMVGGRIVPAFNMFASGAAVTAENALRGLGNMALWAGGKIAGLSDNISKGIAVQDLSIGRWGLLKGHLQLFAGALTSIGLPAFIASASGLHIMAEAIIETGATLIPAAIAFTAFGAVAIPTVTDLYKIMQSTQTVATAFGTKIYPLTGGFQRLADSVRPDVYVLFGEALLIAGHNTGGFSDMVKGAGKALDDLGARFTYAITQGEGASKFFDQSTKDLAGWGNLIGNIGGIFGALFKVMPGYAEMLLNVANGFTHIAEDIVNSGLGGKIIGIGLAAHGAIFYIGLLGTAFAVLSSKGLGAISGLLEKAAFGVVGLGKAGAIAGDAMMSLSEGAATAAALPWGWISIAAAGIGFLVYQLVTAKSAAQQFADSVQSNLLQTPIQNLGKALGDTLANATGNANRSFYQFLTTLGQSQSQFKGADASILHLTGSVQDAAQANENWKAVVKLAQQDISTYRTNLDTVSAAFGSTAAAMAAMTAAGITSGQFLTTNKQQLEQVIIEAQAYDAALKAATQTSGRYGAAQNALNFVAGDTANALGQQVNAMQKVNQAADALLNTVVGGEQAFIGFEQAIQGMNKDAHAAGASLAGLNSQSLTLANDFYSSAIPAAQKLIDALNLQATSTSDLTKVVATSATQMLQFAGKNTEARSVIVALINNALGPGTVSLKTLNTWVRNNSTSLDGFNQIVTNATIKAGSLAGVLQNQLTAQFRADLLASSGANNAMRNFTDAIVTGGTQTQRFASARAVLIRDLENTGLSAHDATGFVNGLQRQVDALHGKNVTVGVFATAAGGVQITDSMHKALIFKLTHFQKGGKLEGFGGGDRNLALLEDGEAVIDKHKTRKFAPLLKAIGVPGMASGGIAGLAPWTASGMTGLMGPQLGSDVQSEMNSEINAWHILPPNLPGVGLPVGITGPGGGSPAQNVALAQRVLGWSGGEFQDLVNLWTRESGWNQFAYNASSGATGIPQALPYTKMPRSAWLPSQGGQANVLAQETWGADYIRGRYGSPSAAWAHELAFNWYDNGGWLKPGPNFMWNGTGNYEHLSRDNGPKGIKVIIELGDSFRAAGLSHQQLEDIRYTVRTIGGGDVQSAFGRD
jgi:hypothetical protein